MNTNRKLHFINKIYTLNTGDLYGSLIDYIPDFFEEGICIKHDIDDIHYHWMGKNDVVFIGGSGIIDNKDTWNESIAKCIDFCKKNGMPIILFGSGVHVYKDLSKVKVRVDFSAFELAAIRDYNYVDSLGNKIRYVPCATCMSPLFDKQYEIVREFGCVEQHRNKIKDIDVNAYDSVKTICHISQMLEFIGASETVLTNSYHATLWATLMGRRVILVSGDWANKFDYMRHPPTMYSGDLSKDRDAAKVHSGFLAESRALVSNFKEECLHYINSLT